LNKQEIEFYKPVFVVSLIRLVGFEIFEPLANTLNLDSELSLNDKVFELLSVVFDVFMQIVDLESMELDSLATSKMLSSRYGVLAQGLDLAPLAFIGSSYLEFLRIWLQPMCDVYSSDDLEEYLSIADEYSFASDFRKMLDARFLFPFIVNDDLRLQFDKKCHDFVGAIEDDARRRLAMDCVNKFLDECFSIKLNFIYH
jgi:hypothetical protein